MKRLRPMKQPRLVTRRDTEQLASHFERRAQGIATATQLASLRRLEKTEGKRKSWTDFAAVKDALELAQALYAGGGLTSDEFLFYSVAPVESYHDHLTLNGHYKDKLDPITNKLREIEAGHGLKPDEYWRKGEGPEEHDRLNARYEKVLDDEFGKLLREVGLVAHSRLWRDNRKEFDRMREAGRASLFESSDVEHATSKLIGMYEGEATKCAKAKAYYAACVMLGSASEALILLRCLQKPAELERAKAELPKSKRFNKDGPPAWNLGQLIEIAIQAGWIANLETESVVVQIVNLISQLHDIRNLVHPGRHAASKPHVTISQEQYADAKAAYTALRFALEKTTKRHSPKPSA